MTVDGDEVTELSDGWQAASSAPGACVDPGSIGTLAWTAAEVPGTACAVLRSVGADAPSANALDGRDWWYRTRLNPQRPAPGDELVLVFEGLATIAEVYVDGERVLDSESMFARSEVRLQAPAVSGSDLSICFRALSPLLALRRRPRARWRTRLVADGVLRFYRTMLLGRAPGIAPGPPVVGPWRPVRLVRRRAVAVSACELRARVDADGSGVLQVRVALRTLAGPPSSAAVEVTGSGGVHRGELALSCGPRDAEVTGVLRVAGVELWWPHTHGEPSLYDVTLLVETPSGAVRVRCGRVGFRTLAGGEHLERDGLQLIVNGVRVFARGALWTPFEASGEAASQDRIRATLQTMRDAGMNMVRLPGIGAYESSQFHDLCDELGILVWQDFMFANLDYPAADPAFLEAVRAETAQVLADLGGRASLAVLCGSSEIAQQVAMLGLDPAVAGGPIFGELLPQAVAAAGLDAVYVPSAPWGGVLPFRPDRGVANYYGVGGYRRPLEDARRSGVRFAAECLGFANVPDDEGLAEIAPGAPGSRVVHHPLWKAGVPRDVGSGWDFDDVRDHYLQLLFGVDPAELRRSDHERYVELSRAVSGEVMAEVFGEWRRAGSPCGGGLVLWLRDLAPGAGFGVLDHRGRPKVAYHHLRRALAPVAVWMTDEGLAGIDVHVANDSPQPLHAQLRVSLYRDGEVAVGAVSREIDIAAHGAHVENVEEMLGHFVDVSWSYRFGPPAQDVVVASLEAAGPARDGLLAQAFRLPAGRPLARETAAGLGLQVSLAVADGDNLALSVRARRFVYGARVMLAGHLPSDDAFCIEPGGERHVALRPIGGQPSSDGGTVSLTAVNLAGRIGVATAPGP